MKANPERWLPVPGMEGSYEVSDRGRVRSLARIVRVSPSAPGSSPRGSHSGYDRRQPEKILSQHIRGKYLFVRIDDTTFFVAHLMLTSFVGPRPDGHVARHLNDVKTDNRLANLAWGTRSQNYDDAIRNGRFPDTWSGIPGKTHCGYGHPLSGDNLFVTRQGARQCRICMRRRNRESYHRLRGHT